MVQEGPNLDGGKGISRDVGDNSLDNLRGILSVPGELVNYGRRSWVSFRAHRGEAGLIR